MDPSVVELELHADAVGATGWREGECARPGAFDGAGVKERQLEFRQRRQLHAEVRLVHAVDRRIPGELPAAVEVLPADKGRVDGLLYVGDRNNSRIQVFRKDGTFVKEAFIRPATMRGTVLDLNFSKDRDQRWLFVADGRNDKVWILRRADLQVIGEFGNGGQMGGEFTIAHAIAADSRNNLYVGESLTGNRVQRFLYKGTRKATRRYDTYGVRQP